MFFRTKKSGPRSYLQIVENRWENGRSRQRVVTTLGRLDQLQESGQLDALLESVCLKAFDELGMRSSLGGFFADGRPIRPLLSVTGPRLTQLRSRAADFGGLFRSITPEPPLLRAATTSVGCAPYT